MKNHISSLIVLTLLISMLGCKKDFRTFSTVFVNAGYGVASADFYMTKQTTQTSIAYCSQTLYISAQTSINDITSFWVTAHGSSQPLALNQQPYWYDGKQYTVFLYKTDTAYGAFNLTDSFSTPPAGQSSIRFVHLGTDAPALDILIGGTEFADNKVFYDRDHLNFYTPFSGFPAGSYSIQVRQHGTNTILYTQPNLVLADGKVYTLYAAGIINAAAAPSFKIGVETHN